MRLGGSGRRLEVAPGFLTVVHDEGDGPAAVLLHGTPFDARVWDPVVRAVAGRARTVRFDARGHGSSTSTPVADYPRLACDVVAVLDHLDLPDAHVVGHSWGGQIAQQVALDHPTRVNQLSLACTRASPFPGLAPVVRGLRDGTGDPQASLTRWFTSAELADPDDVVGAVRSWVGAAQPRRWADALEMIMSFDVLARLHRLRVSTNVICAELDGISGPEHMAQLADAVAGASFRILPGARHLVPLQHPDRIAALLIRSGDGATAP